MDSFADERDYKLLENDKYTFFVLRRIMSGKCELLLTDHERLIICFSTSPFPVWLWTTDDASKEDMERAYLLAEKHSLLNGAHTFNLKYESARYFIKRGAEDNKRFFICKNMFTYNCPKLIKPAIISDGAVHRCSSEDVDELTSILYSFHKELNMDITDWNSYRLQAEERINAGRTFFWKDGKGNCVACCNYMPDGNTASIGLVFTRPEFRRKHYAENLVYRVTETAMDEGYIPMLYTDADYSASNNCYKKLGYVLQGKLCNISL